MQNIIFRADADAKMGAGHVMRCLAIAEEFKSHGSDCRFLSQSMPDGLKERIEAAGIGLMMLPEREPYSALETLLHSLTPAISFVDGYHFSVAERALIKRQSQVCVLLDDQVIEAPFHADFILNSQPSARPEHYPGMSPESLLLGLDYLPLRREFTELNPLPARERKRILITLGAADPAALSLPLSEALLEALPTHVGIDLVAGAANPRIQALQDLEKREPTRLKLHQDSRKMAELMNHAAVAVSAAGSTLWELAACGTPGIALVVADNQAPALKPPVYDLFTVLDARRRQPVIEKTVECCLDLWRRPGRRESLVRHLLGLNLGRGCWRILEALRSGGVQQ